MSEALERVKGYIDMKRRGYAVEVPLLDDLRALVAELEWRPIETAPPTGWMQLKMGWRGWRLGRRAVEAPNYAWEFFEMRHDRDKRGDLWLNAIHADDETAPTQWRPLP